MPRPESPALTVPERTLPAEVINALNQAVQQLRFGLVQLIIHDGKVVQLDVTERHRF
jgi:hypothetical protein